MYTSACTSYSMYIPRIYDVTQRYPISLVPSPYVVYRGTIYQVHIHVILRTWYQVLLESLYFVVRRRAGSSWTQIASATNAACNIYSNVIPSVLLEVILIPRAGARRYKKRRKWIPFNHGPSRRSIRISQVRRCLFKVSRKIFEDLTA